VATNKQRIETRLFDDEAKRRSDFCGHYYRRLLSRDGVYLYRSRGHDTSTGRTGSTTGNRRRAPGGSLEQFIDDQLG
jgi:hypothetical protein